MLIIWFIIRLHVRLQFSGWRNVLYTIHITHTHCVKEENFGDKTQPPSTSQVAGKLIKSNVNKITTLNCIGLSFSLFSCDFLLFVFTWTKFESNNTHSSVFTLFVFVYHFLPIFTHSMFLSIVHHHYYWIEYSFCLPFARRNGEMRSFIVFFCCLLFFVFFSFHSFFVSEFNSEYILYKIYSSNLNVWHNLRR